MTVAYIHPALINVSGSWKVFQVRTTVSQIIKFDWCSFSVGLFLWEMSPTRAVIFCVSETHWIVEMANFDFGFHNPQVFDLWFN